MGWENYSEKRFKQIFRVSKGTFNLLLSKIGHKLQREVVTEDPIPPEFHLAICVNRLGRGDCIYSIAEMVGLGQSTVSTIVNEVDYEIVVCMWDEFLRAHSSELQLVLLLLLICFKLATYIATSKKANSSQRIKYNVT